MPGSYPATDSGSGAGGPGDSSAKRIPAQPEPPVRECHPCRDSFPEDSDAIVNPRADAGSERVPPATDPRLAGTARGDLGFVFPFSSATAAYPADLLPRARGMVVVTGQNKVSGNPDDAMSSSDAEDDFQEPATPTATQAGQALPLLPQQFPEVVPLNVGGMHFTTRLSTLRRYEDTMLAAMFSGRHYIPTDAEGRYFIDRDGTYFGDILNFLRSGDLPPRERVRSVYKEAQYYSIGPLLDNLEDIQPLKGEKVRQAFLGLMPYYKDHLERIIEIAKLRAMQRKARFAKLKVCVFKEEMPITPYECPHFNSLRFERSESETKLFEHHCEVDVSFGPWEAVADVYDLLHCIVTDLSDRGITVDHQCIGVCDKHLINHYYCKRPIYEFKITWW
ncbi:BTB/POZ domain-containing protein KCTD7 isoform X1 [Myiozetetes cayanensis]|nr:BTB/POZ domain-containing protein KCTD7 isoform X1 [Myiozetetes cayanensis]XP_050177871.1 BTB/POZ domain-containing protein KCTD7 isoform X1 [Myiozetetes cayanensis]XP_050177872.1 BTB/POZ domain-containing protein KCTD7 isoform X1 [Myiozetetes cayanensis]